MTNHQLFLKYAKVGKKMDALYALRLLIKAYISACSASIGMRTLVYTAGEVWSCWRLPLYPNNPLTPEQMDEPFVYQMPILCEDYKPELYDQFDIAGGFDEKALRRLCRDEIDYYDEDTMRAICWGIYFLPTANKYFMEAEFMNDIEAAEYLRKQRAKLNRSIENSLLSNDKVS